MQPAILPPLAGEGGGSRKGALLQRYRHLRSTTLKPAPDHDRVDDTLDTGRLTRGRFDESALHVRVDGPVQIDRVLERLHGDVPGRDRLVRVQLGFDPLSYLRVVAADGGLALLRILRASGEQQ